ncbi:hypothetical protein FBEOM_8548 [Fusarium beomiforme]|uniref:Uncharacterized protein n=1 Tax=Fusarium beomiforme TaxID=44412 RepID=A0A9P5AEY7_9HYPO|nr:hypothetical protein FBEOM_8548 [Fusarium beomiforme]
MFRLSTISCGLGLLLPVYARVISDPCATTTTLPAITVTKGPDGYYNQYTRTYQEFFNQGLTTKVYTITQSCSSMNCQPLPIETAPPPGFTSAIVKCDKCGGSGTKVATLTFPTESVEAYSSSGYIVVPIPQQTQIPLGQSESSESSTFSGDESSTSNLGNALNNHGASLSTNPSNGQDSASDGSQIGTSSMEAQSGTGDSPNNGNSSDETDSPLVGDQKLSDTPTSVYHFTPSISSAAGSPSDQSPSSSDGTASSDTTASRGDTSYPIPNQKTGNAGDTSGASSNAPNSAGKPGTKGSGDDSWNPDAPITVNSADHIETNVLTCVLVNIAGMLALSLLV